MFSTLFQRKKGSAFHGTLKRVVQSGGIYKQKKGKQININMMLVSKEEKIKQNSIKSSGRRIKMSTTV